MKKIISLILAVSMLLAMGMTLTSCFGGENEKIYVQTNAYFAPFEYYDGSNIVGVDVEIMELVGEKLGKDIVWQDGDFGIIIDTVADGTLADCGAAGLTITPEREAGMSVSIPYLANKQVAVIAKADATKLASKNYDEFVTKATDCVIIVEKGSAGESMVKPAEEE